MTRDSLSAVSKPPKATLDDLLPLGDGNPFEIIDGELVEKAGATVLHGHTLVVLGSLINTSYGKRGSTPTGGWWIATGVHVVLGKHEVYSPDLAGWRRENLSELPKRWPTHLRPDWVCEVVSESNAVNDLVRKFRGYHAARVPHYWIVDPREESLVVHRYTPEGYLAVVTAVSGEIVRAEPFDAIEIRVGELFGHD